MPRTSNGRRTARYQIESDCARIEPLVENLTRQLREVARADDRCCYEVALALTEAIANAVIHGNLEIPSSVREDGVGALLGLAERRRRAEPFASRRVQVTCDCRADRVVYVIRDEGPGFDVGALPPPDAWPADRISGRGMLLIRAYMDRVEHNARGNEIRLTKHLRHTDDAAN
jgi:anti-sigma regulatory factor (Ser/Thr protein kinase)